MCCRYHIKEYALDFLRRLGADNLKEGEVHPGDSAPAITAGDSTPVVTHLKWGIASRCKSLVINARSETLWEKPMFRESAVRRRCVLPADCFYEWDGKKSKNSFWPRAGGALFIAGLYDECGCFAVITKNADSVMRPVHDRMPVCLQENLLCDWLTDESKARAFLANDGVFLRRERPAEQGSLLEWALHR